MVSPNEVQAQLTVKLMRLALAAPNISSAVTPILNALVERTAAVGAAYFQLMDGHFQARVSSGEMPTGPAMDAILAHGLPQDSALIGVLETTAEPLLYPDVSRIKAAQGLSELGVVGLGAAPVHDRSGTLLGVFLMHTFKYHDWSEDEAELLAVVSGVLASLAARLVAEEHALKAKEGAIRALGLAVERRDAQVKGHTDRVTGLALEIAATMNLRSCERTAVSWGAYLHDVGKIAMPDAILNKPAALDAGEWEVMRRHPDVGYDFVRSLMFLPKASLDIIRYHHERWQGGGYPENLQGRGIPLVARIFSVCDVYDALTSVRPYKPAWSHDDALREINAQAGKQFDPVVVDVFNRLEFEGLA